MTDAAITRQIRVLPTLDRVEAGQWDALNEEGHPLLSHAFLSGLEATGCLRPEWGWTPCHLTIWDADVLVAAAPGYVKHNSHGEFVFDHAWARAYEQRGLDYFPKWLCAVPYSPVTGPRLLARNDDDRAQLIVMMQRLCEQQGWSSAHVNFLRADESEVFPFAWMERLDIQYHWHNAAGWRTFDDYLGAFDHKHRKNIRQERAKVSRAGITYRVVDGTSATADDLRAMHGFYLQTFADYGNHPALTFEFLQHLVIAMPRSLVLILAERDGHAIAGALCFRSKDTLYGRYWGSIETHPGLHFDTCYYQGIEYCLREGLTHFEPGAQGEHKLARGFLPTLVRSRHWVASELFKGPLLDWCEQERASILAYADTLAKHSPFKKPGDASVP